MNQKTSKKKLKKQWKISVIVFGAFVLVFAGILAVILLSLNNSSHSDTKTNTKLESSLTEPTTVEKSILPLNKSDVEAEICTLSGNYGFGDSVKYFALSY